MIICCFSIIADGSDPLAYGVASAVAVVLLMFACIIIAVAIGVCWKRRQSRQMNYIDDFEHELPQSNPEGIVYDVPSSTMQTNPAYVTVETCMTTR